LGETCSPDQGKCCLPIDCAAQGFECGITTDYCGNTLDCGTCHQFPGSTCSPTHLCECHINCVNRVCGDDGCGGSCGTCDANRACRDGLCVECASDADCLDGDACTLDYCNAAATCHHETAPDVPECNDGNELRFDGCEGCRIRPFRLETAGTLTSARYSPYPEIEPLDNGGYVVSWFGGSADSSSPTPGYGVYARTFSASGSPMGDLQEVAFWDGTGEYAGWANLWVEHDANNNTLIAWNSMRNAGGGVVRARFLDGFGRLDGPEFLMTPSDGSGAYAAFTALQDGRWLVVWTAYFGGPAYASFVEQATRSVSTPVLLHGADTPVTIIGLWTLADGRVVYLFNQEATKIAVLYDGTQLALSPSVLEASVSQPDPYSRRTVDLAPVTGNEVLIGWSDGSGTLGHGRFDLGGHLIGDVVTRYIASGNVFAAGMNGQQWARFHAGMTEQDPGYLVGDALDLAGDPLKTNVPIVVQAHPGSEPMWGFDTMNVEAFRNGSWVLVFYAWDALHTQPNSLFVQRLTAGFDKIYR